MKMFQVFALAVFSSPAGSLCFTAVWPGFHAEASLRSAIGRQEVHCNHIALAGPRWPPGETGQSSFCMFTCLQACVCPLVFQSGIGFFARDGDVIRDLVSSW